MRFYGENSGGELTPLEQETTQEATTEPVDTTDEGSVETPTDGDSGNAADGASKTELDSGTTDSTE